MGGNPAVTRTPEPFEDSPVMTHAAELNPIIGGVLGVLAVLGLVAIVGGLLHARRHRLLIHAERMKALELGRGWPGDREPEAAEEKSGSSRCFGTATTACFWGFVFAVAAASKEGGNTPGAAYAIAGATGAIAVTGLICGTVLAARPSPPDGTAKPHHRADEV